MDKKQLLKDLRKKTYCRLRPSPIHGVGVFAIRDIPKGVNPFQSCKKARIVAITKAEKSKLPKTVQRFLADFCPLRGEKYLVPDFGLNAIDNSHYLNHSDYPNMSAVFYKKAGDTEFIALRKIKTGEELTVDYATYSDDTMRSSASANLRARPPTGFQKAV